MTWKDVSAASFDSIPVDVFMGFMSNSSMNYQITNRINCDFILLLFSMAYRQVEMATHPCVAETLN